MRISDHSRPVLMCTDATLAMLTLISSRLNQDRLRRVTDLSLTSITVRNNRFPRVKRDAWNNSVGIRRALYGSRPAGAPEDWKRRIARKPRIRERQSAPEKGRALRRLNGLRVRTGAAQPGLHRVVVRVHLAMMTDP